MDSVNNYIIKIRYSVRRQEQNALTILELPKKYRNETVSLDLVEWPSFDIDIGFVQQEYRVTVFLLGLRELHKLRFAHWDLKKENILVDDDLTLIFGDPDFIKSENDNILKTFCDTALYAVSEIWPRRSKSYRVSVDIGSLVICILNLFYNLV